MSIWRTSLKREKGHLQCERDQEGGAEVESIEDRGRFAGHWAKRREAGAAGQEQTGSELQRGLLTGVWVLTSKQEGSGKRARAILSISRLRVEDRILRWRKPAVVLGCVVVHSLGGKTTRL